jgi:acyl-CoA synthetase (AMP-forming)/AMP-acid ligase II
MALGGRIVIMHHPDIGEFLRLIEAYGVTHAFLPPTVIYMVLDNPKLDDTDLSSLQCFWYGAAPISAARLEEALKRIGPMAQLFGQTEAPMMISTLSPEQHYNEDGAVAWRASSSITCRVCRRPIRAARRSSTTSICPSTPTPRSASRPQRLG